MHEELVFAQRAWYPRHRPDIDCWCRPTVRGEGELFGIWHRHVPSAGDHRPRAIQSGVLRPPV